MHTTPTAEFTRTLFIKKPSKKGVNNLLSERWDIDCTLRILLADRLFDFLSVSLLQLVGTPNAAAGSDFVCFQCRNTVWATMLPYAQASVLGLFFCCQGQTYNQFGMQVKGGWYERLNFGTNALKKLALEAKKCKKCLQSVVFKA
jgi:hypothetical protein